MTICYADTETRSECDLKACGTAAYAEHPSTRIQLLAYSFDDSSTAAIWDNECGEPMPKDLKEALADPEVIFTYHNVFFDRSVKEATLGIKLPIQRYRCSMAQALSHGLPGSLDKLGEVLGVREDSRKIKDGKRLVQKFCKPRKQKDGTLKWSTPYTDPEDWERYKEYCKMDVLAMKAIIKKMPKWNYPNQNELELWYMDQIVNSRGMQIDIDLVNAAVRAIESEQKSLSKRTKDLTSGEVQAASQRDAMIRYIAKEYGFDMENMRKATLEKMLEQDELPESLRELLEVRLSTCTTSTAKYKKLINAVNKDGRLRGTIQYAGASRTSRDGGRLYQPQNLPRPTLQHDDIINGIEALKLDAIEILGYDTMKLTGSALRYAIVAKPKHKLVIADLSAIEGRVLAYLAGEEWKLQAYRDYDAGRGQDLYKTAYARAFGIDPRDVIKNQRQIGKVLELAFGFRGGIGAFMAFASKMDLSGLPGIILPSVPKNIIIEAEKFYEWMNDMDIKEAKDGAKKSGVSDQWEDFYDPHRTFGLEKNIFIAIDCLKRLWRKEHSAVQKFWNGAEEACKNAVYVPNTKFYFSNCYAARSGKWVKVVLPSGHAIPYPGMDVDENGKLFYMGTNQFTKQWCKIYTSSGKIVENCVQSFARDIFKYGQLAAEKAGYRVILPVHDEIVAEVPDTDEYSAKKLEEIMSEVPPWAKGIPLNAEGFEDYRYHK